MAKHPLHKAVGDLLEEFAKENKQKGFEARLDEACGGNQYIPLFSCSVKKRETRLCCVDAMLLKNGNVAVVVEIEESSIEPNQICGKYLTTALAKEYNHEKESKAIALEKNSVNFIQIVDTDSVSKIRQVKKIEKAINDNLCGCVKSYNAITIDWNQEEEEKNNDELKCELYKILKEVLNIN